jgi:hypothetical protein
MPNTASESHAYHIGLSRLTPRDRCLYVSTRPGAPHRSLEGGRRYTQLVGALSNIMQAFKMAYSLSRHPAKGFQSLLNSASHAHHARLTLANDIYIDATRSFPQLGAPSKARLRPSSYFFRCTAPPWFHTNPVKGINLCPILPPMPQAHTRLTNRDRDVYIDATLVLRYIRFIQKSRRAA